MKWNLRLAAANRGIWKASELQRILADHGLVISAGKLSGMWAHKPISVKLDDLEVICIALDCSPDELFVIEPDNVTRPAPATDAGEHTAAAGATAQPTVVTPRPRTNRSLPPR